MNSSSSKSSGDKRLDKFLKDELTQYRIALVTMSSVRFILVMTLFLFGMGVIQGIQPDMRTVIMVILLLYVAFESSEIWTKFMLANKTTDSSNDVD